MKYTVYQTTNLVNNKIYIGVHKTEDVNDSYLGSGSIIKEAIKKYGKRNFRKEILFVFNCPDRAYDKERDIIDEAFVKREDTYNIDLGGRGAMRGRKHTLETKAKMSKAQAGKKLSAEHRAKIAYSRNGTKATDETKAKMSKAQAGKKLSAEHRKNIRLSKLGKCNPQYGKPLTNEHRAKMSKALKGGTKKKTIVICPHCDKEGIKNAMMRYHFGKCKSIRK